MPRTPTPTTYDSKKIEFFVFRNKNTPLNFKRNIHLFGTLLRQVAEFRYLGYVATERLDDDSDIELERRALRARANMLARKFARRTAQVKLTLFKDYCQSFYTWILWADNTQRAYGAACSTTMC